MKKNNKNRLKDVLHYNKILMISNIILFSITSVISVSAVSYLYSSKDVSYDNSNSKIKSTNVQGAVEELYEEATNYSTINTKVTNLENGKQDKITGGATTIAGNNLTASRALISDSNGKVGVSSTTSTELGYVHGVTSAIQTQLNAKAALASPTFTGTPKAPTAAAGTNTTQLATTAFVTNAQAKNVKYAITTWGTTLSFNLKAAGHALVFINSGSVWLCWVSAGGLAKTEIYGKSGATLTFSNNIVTVKHTGNATITALIAQ